MYLHPPSTNTDIYLNRLQDIQLRAPGVRHISGSAGPRLARISQPQPAASKRLRLSEEVKRRLLEMCVGEAVAGEQTPVSGAVSSHNISIYHTLRGVYCTYQYQN